jgi:hypothetical protein
MFRFYCTLIDQTIRNGRPLPIGWKRIHFSFWIALCVSSWRCYTHHVFILPHRHDAFCSWPRRRRQKTNDHYQYRRAWPKRGRPSNWAPCLGTASGRSCIRSRSGRDNSGTPCGRTGPWWDENDDDDICNIMRWTGRMAIKPKKRSSERERERD